MKKYFILFIMILLVGVIFEITLLLMKFLFADEVECNYLWCEFKYTNEYTILTSKGFECYINDVKHECNETEIEDFKKLLNIE